MDTGSVKFVGTLWTIDSSLEVRKDLKKFVLSCLLLVSFLTLVTGTLPVRADSSHQVVGKTTPSDTFATTDQGCLGPLRSEIAQGQFSGVGPFGEHFNGTVDPGAQYGTAGEANVVTAAIGVNDSRQFCASITSKN